MGRAEPQCIEGGPWVNIDWLLLLLIVPKTRYAVAIADDGRGGEVRYLGEIDNSPDAVRKLVAKLTRQYERLHFFLRGRTDGRQVYAASEFVWPSTQSLFV